MKIVISAAVMVFSIFVSISLSFASTDTYDSGRDHGCDDAGISDQSHRYINQPGKGFMDGYNDGFYECSVSNGNFIGGDGNVTLGVECQMRALNDGELFQQLSEHQCFYFNSCMNLGGSIPGCYAGARIINCDIENGKSYYCPIVLMKAE